MRSPLVVALSARSGLVATAASWRRIANGHDVTKALGLDRPDETLGVGLQVRASRRQAQQLHVGRCQDLLKVSGVQRSLSTIRWRTSFRKPLAASVRLRATCATHATSGLFETPAT